MTDIALQNRIEANSIPEPNSGCWLWLLSCDHSGYGNISILGRKFSAHRVSWAAFNNAIPAGACVLHRCDVPCCVNPDHLWLGTHSDNMRDCVAKGRFRGGLGPRSVRRNTVGATYVAKNDRWQAQISGRYLGFFKTKEEASAAYWAARNEVKS